jgi:DNA recombination protein RmuC
MQNYDWNTTTILLMVIFSVASLAIGYLVSTLKLNKLNQKLSIDLTMSQTALTELNQSFSDIQKTLNFLQTEHQDLALAHGKLEERNASLTDNLQSQQVQTKETTQALKQELQESKGKFQSAQESLAEIDKQGRGFEEQAKQVEIKYQDAILQRNELQQKLETLREQNQNLLEEHTELKTTLEQREVNFNEQMTQFAESKQEFTKEFENLANKIFEEKGKTFTDTSKISIDSMLKPFREQIESFQKRVNEVHDSSIQGNTNLGAEIRKVLDIGLQMSKEANNLTSALKGDSQQRGAWGEAQLRRTLEMSGLIEDAHYEVQSAFKDAEGKSKQTDYLIKLPDGKHIIIDSKVSLNAYDRAVSAETPEKCQIAMGDHIKAVRKHIDDLSSKDYTNLVGMKSPNFVLMFMPIEPAYIEALKSNKDLFDYGYKKGIVLVSHTTLIPILRTVSNLWMMERSNAEAKEISEKAGDIYNQVCIVSDRLSKLGNTLNTASNHYNNTVKALAGQQGLYGKVERFNQLSTKVSRSLPNIETSHMDYETERLSLIVEPIIEEVGASETSLQEEAKPLTELLT